MRLRDTPRVPAKLLVGGKAEPGEPEELQALFRELAARWPELMPGMSLSMLEGADHYIQKDCPEVVANEIRALVDGLGSKH